MIRSFKMGNSFKDSLGKFSPFNKNLANYVEGIGQYDRANTWDINRPTKELINNDDKLNKIIKNLSAKNFQTGIISGCSVTIESYIFQNNGQSYIGSTNLSTLNNNVSINYSVPFVTPKCFSTGILTPETSFDYVNKCSTHAYKLDDGIIVGLLGDFFSIEPNFIELQEILTQALLLEPYLNDLISCGYNTTNNGLGDFVLTMTRNANGISGDTVTRTATIYFSNIDEKGSFGLLNNTDFQTFNTSALINSNISSVLYSNFKTRLVFRRGDTAGNSCWNFICLNESTNQVEVWYPIQGINVAYSATIPEFDKVQYVNYLQNTLNLTVLYSAVVDSTGVINFQIGKNGYQELGFVGLTNSPPVPTGQVSPRDYDFTSTLDGGAPAVETFTVSTGTGTPIYFSDIVTGLQSALAGTDVSIIDGDIRITSLTTGATSAVSLANSGTNPLFSSTNLTGFLSLEGPVDGTATTYDIMPEIQNYSSRDARVFNASNYNAIQAITSQKIGDFALEHYYNFIYQWDGTIWRRIVNESAVSTDTTMLEYTTDPSGDDSKIPTQKAAKAYVDNTTTNEGLKRIINDVLLGSATYVDITYSGDYISTISYYTSTTVNASYKIATKTYTYDGSYNITSYSIQFFNAYTSVIGSPITKTFNYGGGHVNSENFSSSIN